MAFFHYKSLSLLCFLVTVSLISLVESIGVTVDLIRRDSPHSPSYALSHTRFDRIRNAINRSFTRKSALSQRLLSNAASLPGAKSISATISPGGSEFLMKVGLGTPPVEQLLIADTGSDLLWTQCKPCLQCYKQNSPLFDPSKTSTFRHLPCESAQCASVGTGSCGPRRSCKYEVNYGDMSYSRGDVAVETLTLGSSKFGKVVFGCGHANQGTFQETSSGIIGLGGGEGSIVRQLGASIGGRFSYCLTPVSSNASSKISFGSDAVVKGRGVVTTPLVRKEPDTYYYLTLEAISVGNKRLDNYDNGTDSKAVISRGNIIIDSGTTLTFVPSDLYGALRRSLVSAIKGTRVTDPEGTFDLCYRVPRGGAGLAVPRITAHFTGADVVLPREGLFFEIQEGVACLALVPSQDDLAIFGNLQQINHRIGYDTVARVVNFLPTDCTKSR